MSSLWGNATPFILWVYGLTAASFGALVALSLLDARRWARKARELEAEQKERGA